MHKKYSIYLSASFIALNLVIHLLTQLSFACPDPIKRPYIRKDGENVDGQTFYVAYEPNKTVGYYRAKLGISATGATDNDVRIYGSQRTEPADIVTQSWMDDGVPVSATGAFECHSKWDDAAVIPSGETGNRKDGPLIKSITIVVYVPYWLTGNGITGASILKNGQNAEGQTYYVGYEANKTLSYYRTLLGITASAATDQDIRVAGDRQTMVPDIVTQEWLAEDTAVTSAGTYVFSAKWDDAALLPPGEIGNRKDGPLVKNVTIVVVALEILMNGSPVLTADVWLGTPINLSLRVTAGNLVGPSWAIEGMVIKSWEVSNNLTPPAQYKAHKVPLTAGDLLNDHINFYWWRDNDGTAKNVTATAQFIPPGSNTALQTLTAKAIFTVKPIPPITITQYYFSPLNIRIGMNQATQFGFNPSYYNGTKPGLDLGLTCASGELVVAQIVTTNRSKTEAAGTTSKSGTGSDGPFPYDSVNNHIIDAPVWTAPNAYEINLSDQFHDIIMWKAPGGNPVPILQINWDWSSSIVVDTPGGNILSYSRDANIYPSFSAADYPEWDIMITSDYPPYQ